MKLKLWSLLVFFSIPFVALAQIDFTAAPRIKGLWLPDKMEHGDFDGNGKEDMVMSTGPNPELTFLYTPNDGSLNYTIRRIKITPGFANSRKMYVADFNKDGKDDIAMVDYTDEENFRLFVGLSTGMDFSATSVADLGIGERSIAVGDVDNDGNLDVVVAGRDQSIKFLKGNGAGGFTASPATNFPSVSADLFDVYLLDINKDGRLDFVMHNYTSVTSWTKNAGIGYTSSDVHVDATYPGYGGTVLADFSGDGFPDIVSIFQQADWTLQYFVNNGAGGFFEPTVVDTRLENYFGIDHADYDHDGKEDILIGSFSDDKSVLLLHSLGNSFEDKSPDFETERNGIMDVAFVDIQGTGDLEIVACSVAQQMYFYKKNGAVYEHEKTSLIGVACTNGTIYDVDNDGFDDLVGISMNGAVSVWYGKGDAAFEEVVIFPFFGEGHGIDVADFNNDGFGDIAFSTGDYNSVPTRYTTSILMSTGARTFTRTELENSYTYALTAGDINNDGFMDLVSSNVAFRNKGNGTFDYLAYNAPFYMYQVVLGNFDNDEYLDIASVSNSKLYISHNDHTGSFGPFNEYNGTGPVELIHKTDLNNDQIDDLIGIVPQSIAPNDIVLMKGDGNGQFTTSHITGPANNFLFYPAAGDINNDGLTDIVANFSTSSDYYGLMAFVANQTGGYETLEFRTTFKENELFFGNSLELHDMDNDNRLDAVMFSLNIYATGIVLNKLIVEPVTAPSELQVTAGGTTAEITLKKGNGDGRLITIRKDEAADGPPADGTFYIANEIFGVGSAINKNYAVMRSDETTVTVTGLQGSTKYFVNAFEYNANSKGDIINYFPTPASISFTTSQSQTITIAPVTPKAFGEGTYTITATASSGLNVALSLVSGSGTLNGNVFTPTAPGKVTVKADQAGNSEFGPATQQITFCVNPPKPTISVSYDPSALLTSSSDNNNAWFLGNSAVEGAISKTFSPTEEGSYRVEVTVDGCINSSDPTANVILAVEDNFTTSFSISPNPATSFVRIGLPTGHAVASEPVFYNSIGAQFQLPTVHKNDAFEVNTSDLHPGLYIIKLQGVSLKMIKQ